MADQGSTPKNAGGAGGGGKSNRKLKNYILDWRYQLRYTLTMVGISVVLTGGLGYVVMSKAREASRVVEVRAMDPTDEMAQMLAKQFQQNDQVLVWSLIGFGLLLAGALSAYGIVLTHKVAGPLFKVTTYLDRMRDGKLGQVYNLRKGDELVEFFEHFKRAHETLRTLTEEDIAVIDKALAAIGDVPIAAELRALKEKKIESLK